jgi:enoyl-CoA hydratase/carnithine racemase
MSEFFKIERDGPVTILIIDRADAMNALDVTRHFAMSDLIDAFAADPDQRVLIISGAGDRAFCAGNDLKQQLPPGQQAVPPSGFGGLTLRQGLGKPVIAAVNGLALGGGFELALACDMAVASENATFGIPEARVGLAALAGGLLRLPLHIGPKRTMELVMTARRMGAGEALELGLVNKVVPVGETLKAAREVAETICAAAPLAIRAAKAVMQRGIEGVIAQPLQDQLDIPEVIEMRMSEDAKEGPRAFAEKRAPRWTGC